MGGGDGSGGSGGGVEGLRGPREVLMLLARAGGVGASSGSTDPASELFTSNVILFARAHTIQANLCCQFTTNSLCTLCSYLLNNSQRISRWTARHQRRRTMCQRGFSLLRFQQGE